MHSNLSNMTKIYKNWLNLSNSYLYIEKNVTYSISTAPAIYA